MIIRFGCERSDVTRVSKYSVFIKQSTCVMLVTFRHDMCRRIAYSKSTCNVNCATV